MGRARKRSSLPVLRTSFPVSADSLTGERPGAGQRHPGTLATHGSAGSGAFVASRVATRPPMLVDLTNSLMNLATVWLKSVLMVGAYPGESAYTPEVKALVGRRLFLHCVHCPRSRLACM